MISWNAVCVDTNWGLGVTGRSSIPSTTKPSKMTGSLIWGEEVLEILISGGCKTAPLGRGTCWASLFGTDLRDRLALEGWRVCVTEGAVAAGIGSSWVLFAITAAGLVLSSGCSATWPFFFRLFFYVSFLPRQRFEDVDMYQHRFDFWYLQALC